MRRRRALLSTTATLAGLAGCSGILGGDETATSPDRTTASPGESPTPNASIEPTDRRTQTPTTQPTHHPTETPTPEPTDRPEPPESFHQEWTFGNPDDWVERNRVTEYPETTSTDWRPPYARTAEFSHGPTTAEFEAAIEATEGPRLACAVMSKWKLPDAYSNSPYGLAHTARTWVTTTFDDCPLTVVGPETVHVLGDELRTGYTVGMDRLRVEGDTGQLGTAFRAVADGASVRVQRVTYEADGILYGLHSDDRRFGYFVVGAWPATDAVTLHTDGRGTVDVAAPVRGEHWRLERRVRRVLERVDLTAG